MKDADLSLARKEFAAAHGVSLRTAQRQSKLCTQEWKSFLAERACRANGVLATMEKSRGKTDLERATETKEFIYSQIEGLKAQQELAIMDPEKAELVPSLAKAIRETRKAWEDACKHEDRLKLSMHLYVSADKVRAVQSAAVRPLSELATTQRDWMLSRLPQEMRPKFLEIFDAYLTQWNASVADLNRQLSVLINA